MSTTPPERGDPDYIWLKDVPSAFPDITVDMLRTGINAGELETFTFAGDKKTYLLRSRIRTWWMTPKVERKTPQEQPEQRRSDWRGEE
jgi:hypothetical protein